MLTFMKKIQAKKPIVFIGSGITKRYFRNIPDWKDLLLKIWSEVGYPEDFYVKYYELEKKFGINNTFDINIRLVEDLQSKYNEAFFCRKIEMKNLTLKEAYENSINPFKLRIANEFSDLELDKKYSTEIVYFCEMIKNVKTIVTTNYDTFIENCYKKEKIPLEIYLKDCNFLNNKANCTELYKIHGSIDDVNSIVITKNDYKKNEKESILINAKILSKLTESPLIFLGYSLTDRSIQNMLSGLTEASCWDISEIAARIGVVKYDKDNMDIDETIKKMNNTNLFYTSIKTDNYIELYKKLIK